jgi:hypothetical protein
VLKKHTDAFTPKRSSQHTLHKLLFNMGCQTKVQHIARVGSEQFYVTIPSALAHALEIQKGETFEWVVADKGHLYLSRLHVPPDPACAPAFVTAPDPHQKKRHPNP